MTRPEAEGCVPFEPECQSESLERKWHEPRNRFDHCQSRRTKVRVHS